jgi:uncharacterized protein DUF6644
MTAMLESFAFWLRGTSLSEAIRVSSWLWPVCEMLHFFGLSLLVGVAGLFDLRLLGFMKRVPISAAWTLMPWAKFGFALAALTGVTFFIGAPDQYVTNPAFYCKVFFLIVANVNAVYFEALYRRQIETRALDESGPMALKVIGAVSIVSWFFVIYWGRMLPFIGNAF